MSNFALSVLNVGQAKVKANVNAPEQRRRMPTVMELSLKNQDYADPSIKALQTSPLRTVRAYYRKNIAAGSDTAKAYNHSGTFGDSGYTSVTYVTHVEKFGVPLKIGANNVYSYQDVWNDAYQMAWKNLRTRHDTAALAFLYANRMQLSSATINAELATAGLQYWNETNYALEIPDSMKGLFVQKIKDAMVARSLFGNGGYDIVADLQMSTAFQNYFNQGSGNFQNTSWQFGDETVASSATVLDSNYSNGSVFIMPKGTFYGINWNEQANLNGLPQQISDGTGSIGLLGTINDPFGSGAVCDLSMYSKRSDTSANTTGGSTQDFVLETELTLTIGYIAPPLSTASDSVIMEVAQMPVAP